MRIAATCRSLCGNRAKNIDRLLGKFHLNLLADFLPLLITPGREDVPVLQFLLAGPVS